MRSLLGRFHRPMSRGLVNNMLTMNNLGDGSTLSLDFTTMGGVLDPRLTFTRASTVATYINSNGYVATATTNEPRFDYSPTNIGEPRGLLVEGQGINVCIYSQAIASAGWNTTTGYTVTTNTTDLLSPARDNTATKLVYTSGYARCTQTVNLAANTTYTMSYWIKSVMTHTFRVYDLTAGADIASSIGSIPVTSSWTRVQKTFTTGASTSSCWFYVANDGGPTAGMTAYVWGAQLELGSGASSLIPTGASQVTRNADSCVMTGTNFSSWFAGATEGVLFAEYEKPRSQSGNAAHDYSAVASKYNTGEGLIVYAGNSNFYPTNILWPTGGAIFAGGIATAIPSVTKQAAKWFAANDLTMYSNGVVGSTAAGTGTVTLAMLSFGANSNTGTEATRDWLNACVRRVKFYPTALSNAAIQALTAP